MKKVLLALFALILFSCSAESDFTPTQESQEIDQTAEVIKVKSQIDSLSQMMVASNPDAIETRGLRSWFKKIVKVVVADAGGALVGSTFGPFGTFVGAAVASGTTAAALASGVPVAISVSGSANISCIMGTNTMQTSLSGNIPSINTTLAISDSIGYYHNKYFFTVKDKLDTSSISYNDLVTMADAMALSVYGIGETNLLNLGYANIQNYCVKMQNLVLRDDIDFDTVSEFIDEVKLIAPSYEDELSVLDSYFDGLVKTTYNPEVFMNQALNVVLSSAFNKDMKVRICNAIIVGNSSYKLWNVE